ncbi:MAG TPA: NTP transferase domain-containing protein [Caldisericia bacterium]|nr:NTP transferase domain-containing protein [Caldisericia bacterium]HPF49016.1 NTP transferase domain-containing protein [Caldisericia bacterium]HPI83120.1 NTP transferase domain-containing protein [Caldisericia bacterium]HPQ92347.1 NTP transferase domain-containing protein [Caldisericia bacterium]HRV74555.1 NTP transferase domain-containing protein [Caldisericia bacterium]
MKNTIEAVILGGGGVEDWFAHEHVKNKGMLEIAGKPMITFTIDALKATEGIENITLIGDNYSDEITSSVTRCLPDSGTLSGNIEQAFRSGDSEYVLITTSDIPLVTADTFNGVLKSLFECEKDLSLPVITKEDTENKFPGTKRTYAKLKEGKVKVGNVFLLKRSSYEKIRPIVEETAKRRKSVLKQALQLGVGFLLRLIFVKNVSIPELEKRVEKILGISVQAPILPYPELGVDVDKISDLEFCRNLMEKH